MYQRLLRITYKLERNPLFASIKKGLLLLIPVLLTGSFALMLRSLPFPGVSSFMEQAAGGLLMKLLDLVYDATFGLMAIYLLCGVSYSYASEYQEQDEHFRLMAVMASLGCFLAYYGAPLGTFAFKDLGAVGVFPAILCGILGTALFHFLVKRLPHRSHSYAAGADHNYHAVTPMILPLALCVTVFAAASILLQRLTGKQNLNLLMADMTVELFQSLSNELASGAVFVLLLGGLWFFGIHGGNVMEQVAQTFFLTANANPDVIVCKSFLDTFVLMGGCGATLCLLLALLLCSKNRGNKNLAWSTAPFALFNINELLIYGLPVLFNPMLVLPFLLTPLLSLGIAYGATVWGFLPVVTNSITWTTPVLFSGYAAVGSMRGVVVQLVILAAGTALYAPFVRLSDGMQQTYERMALEELIQQFRREYDTPQAGGYLGRPGQLGAMAKALAGQLRQDIQTHALPVYYQPQVDAYGRTVGAEALLRWQYCGNFIPPPLVIALAQEDGTYDALTACVLETAAADAARFSALAEECFVLSVNITAGQLDHTAFIDQVLELTARTGSEGRLCLEVTEEDALEQYHHIEANLERLRRAGISAAIDDFSMGRTSLRYLQNNAFQYVKLDGALVRQLPENARCRDIVHSIVALGKDLDFSVIAEYVETEAIQKVLLELGAELFQGYLYSPAIPAEELSAWIQTHGGPGQKTDGAPCKGAI